MLKAVHEGHVLPGVGHLLFDLARLLVQHGVHPPEVLVHSNNRFLPSLVLDVEPLLELLVLALSLFYPLRVDGHDFSFQFLV